MVSTPPRARLGGLCVFATIVVRRGPEITQLFRQILSSAMARNEDAEGPAPMTTPSPKSPARRAPRRTSLAPMATILLAISFGLCAGYLDIGVLFFKKYCWNSEGHFRNARDFPWTVPVGHAVLMLVPGVVVAAVNRFRPVPMSLRAGSWLFATLAIWSALLRMPLYGGCSLLLAAGLGRVIGDADRGSWLAPASDAIDLRDARRRTRRPCRPLVGLAGGS